MYELLALSWQSVEMCMTEATSCSDCSVILGRNTEEEQGARERCKSRFCLSKRRHFLSDEVFQRCMKLGCGRQVGRCFQHFVFSCFLQPTHLCLHIVQANCWEVMFSLMNNLLIFFRAVGCTEISVSSPPCCQQPQKQAAAIVFLFKIDDQRTGWGNKTSND